MAWWIYKCNSKNKQHRGDWDYYFEHPKSSWGATADISQLTDLAVKDFVIAYQTDRNELVGLTKVRSIQRKLYLDPIEEIRVKVRPLKVDPKIDAIEALTSAARKTLHELTPTQARLLLRAARNAKA